MKIILHIGTHKTATTSIQAALREVERELLDDGIGLIPPPSSWHDIQLMTTMEPQLVQKTKKELRKRFEDNPSIKSWIWSWEGFSGNPLDAYRNSEVLAQFIREVTEGCNTKVIVFLRRQDSFVESMYNFSIKVGHSWSFENFLEIYRDGSLDWNRFVDRYAAALPNSEIVVESYHLCKAQGATGIVERFFQLVGCRVSAPATAASRKNVGLQRDAFEVTRIANRFLADDDRVALKRMLNRLPTKEKSEAHGFFEKREDIVSFLDFYRESNRRLSERFFQGESAFPSFVSEGTVYNGLTTEAVCGIFMPLLVQQELRLTRLASENQLYSLRMLKSVERKLKAYLRAFPGLRRALKRMETSLFVRDEGV